MFEELASAKKQISHMYKKLMLDTSDMNQNIKGQWIMTPGKTRCHRGVESQLLEDLES